MCTPRRRIEGPPEYWTPVGRGACTGLTSECPAAEFQWCFCLLRLGKTGNQENLEYCWVKQQGITVGCPAFFTSLPPLLTHLPVNGEVSPVNSVHTVLHCKFGHPVVFLGTTLDNYPRHFPGLAQVYLDPLWDYWKIDKWTQDKDTKYLTHSSQLIRDTLRWWQCVICCKKNLKKSKLCVL